MENSSNDNIDKEYLKDDYESTYEYGLSLFKESLKEVSVYPYHEILPYFNYPLSMIESDVKEASDCDEVVTLMTMHAVKGLEFDVVFITGLEEGLFPHSNSMFDESELEEERRLFYVAITRAKKVLYLTNARSRMLFGQIKSNLPSRFIEEINQEDIEKLFEENKSTKE